MYTKKHDNLNTCTKAAIDLNDNYNIYQEETLESRASSQSDRSMANDLVPRVESPSSNLMPSTKELANEVVKRLNYAQKPLKQNEPSRLGP